MSSQTDTQGALYAATLQTHNTISARISAAAGLSDMRRVIEDLRIVFPLACASGGASHFAALAFTAADRCFETYRRQGMAKRQIWRTLYKNATAVARSYQNRAEDSWHDPR